MIDEDGENIGVVTPERALIMAEDAGLDLVEISPNANPPVCKIMDFGKFKYESQKKEAEARKKERFKKIARGMISVIVIVILSSVLFYSFAIEDVRITMQGTSFWHSLMFSWCSALGLHGESLFTVSIKPSVTIPVTVVNMSAVALAVLFMFS